MIQLDVTELDPQLSQLVAHASKGETILVTDGGSPVARLTGVPPVRGMKFQEIVERMDAIRARSRGGAPTIRELIDEGRRF
jgi:prevent-host-death family protein